MVLSSPPASVRAREAADESGISGHPGLNESGKPGATTGHRWRSSQEIAAEQVAEARARRGVADREQAEIAVHSATVVRRAV